MTSDDEPCEHHQQQQQQNKQHHKQTKGVFFANSESGNLNVSTFEVQYSRTFALT
jgi:hypothetical protein